MTAATMGGPEMSEDPEPSAAAADPLAQAITQWQSAQTQFGERHATTLAALLEVASARWNAGDSLGAVHDCAEALAARRDTLGDQHPDTLAAAGQLAIWRYHRGDPSAVEELRELVPVMTAVLGAEQANTLWATHTLAVAEDGAGDPASRLVRWVQLCRAETRVLGPRHELTLSAAYAAALARHQLGDPFGASNDALIVVGRRRLLLGDNHADTLAAQLSRLTWLAEAQGINTHTLDKFDELIVDMQNALGHDHLYTALARYNRAFWTPDADNGIERISEWEVLAEDLVRVLGEEHAVTIDTLRRCEAGRAEWEADLNDFRGIAFDLLIDVESEQRDVELEPDRDWMATGNLDDDAQGKVADDADEQRGERADLMEHTVALKKALNRSARTLGCDHLETLQWRYYLAWWLWNGHEFDPAAQLDPKTAPRLCAAPRRRSSTHRRCAHAQRPHHQPRWGRVTPVLGRRSAGLTRLIHAGSFG